MKIKTGEGDALKEMFIPYLEKKGHQEMSGLFFSKIAISIIGVLCITADFVFLSNVSLLLSIALCLLILFMGSALFFSVMEEVFNRGYAKLAYIIKDCICSIYVMDSYKVIIIEFGIYPHYFVELPEDSNQLISGIFNTFFSTFSKFKVYIVFYPIIRQGTQTHNTPFDELLKIVENEVNKAAASLPEDIKAKGVEMSKAYLYVYCVENTLRLFIHQQSESKFGSSYLNQIFINSKVKKKVQERKDEETKSKFLTPRGNNDLYYMDFKELGDVIIGNPDLLSNFPNEIWLKAKIEELGNIRNLIAHNNLIGEHEINILKANYQSILRQIGSV